MTKQIEVTADTYTQEEWLEIADKLGRLQAAANDAKDWQGALIGVVHIQDVVFYIRQGDIESAQAVKGIDGDKTRSYPEILAFLNKKMGCRSHNVIDCTSWLCESLREDNE